jgi:hypothetical protein
MWGEVRHALAMAGGPGGTIGAFCALLLYGLVSLIRCDADISRLSAGILLSVAALWLSLVLLGILKSGLAHWSPLAVLLLVLAFPQRPGRRDRPSEYPAPDSEADARSSHSERGDPSINELGS